MADSDKRAAARAAIEEFATAARVRRWARELEAIGRGRSVGSMEDAKGQRRSDADRVAALRLLLEYATGGPERSGGLDGPGPQWRYRLPASNGRMLDAVPVVGVPIDASGRLVMLADGPRALPGVGGSGEGSSPDSAPASGGCVDASGDSDAPCVDPAT